MPVQPIHYDTIEDGQNKTYHCLFSFLVRIVLFLPFNSVIYLEKSVVTSFHSCHLHNNTPLKNKCFNPGEFVFTAMFVTLRVMASAYKRAMRGAL